MKIILILLSALISSYSFAQDSNVQLKITLHSLSQISTSPMECEQLTKKSVLLTIPVDTFATHKYELQLYPDRLDIDRDYFLIETGKKPKPLVEGLTYKISSNLLGTNKQNIRISILNAQLNECEKLSDHIILSLIPR